jgi:hypothetical protein
MIVTQIIQQLPYSPEIKGHAKLDFQCRLLNSQSDFIEYQSSVTDGQAAGQPQLNPVTAALSQVGGGNPQTRASRQDRATNRPGLLTVAGIYSDQLLTSPTDTGRHIRA